MDEIKKELGSYLQDKRLLKEKEDDLEELITKATKVTKELNDMPQGTPEIQDRMAELASQIVDMKKEKYEQIINMYKTLYMFICVKGESMKKKIIIICLIVLVGILIIFFAKNNYKKNKIGNNISNSTLEECEKYIYDINSYEAIVQITVKSNKNENKYLIKQVCKGDTAAQEVLEPENIKGIKIIYKDNQLTVENTKLTLKKIYESYPYVSENVLFLNDFIKQYKQNNENSNIEKNEENVILTVKTKNKYRAKEQLYINIKTGLPEKLVVQDNNKNTTIYISYNEIKLNN